MLGLFVCRAKLADYYHARGYAARKQGNFAGAVEEYSRALSLTPSHFKALFNRGFSYDKVCSHMHRL
jgi:Flp pilus assembly protein TadD